MSDSQLLFGKYRVLSRVGGGGMGEVFRVRKDGPSGISRDLALKRILPEVAAEPRFLQLFLREARALATLNHRAIVQMFEYGSEDGSAFLLMEYLDGVNLAALARQWGKPFPWPAAVFIGIEVAHALAAAHRVRADDIPHGLVHGDLSPSNVMVCTDGAVKLLDFGLARPAGLELSSSRICGKLSYLPPESVAGVPPSAQLDVYALGVILYELVTGTRAFQADNDLQKINLILHADVPPPSTLVKDLPPAFDALLLKAMNRDRARRFADCEQFASALEAVLVSRYGPAQLARFVASMSPDAPSEASLELAKTTLETVSSSERPRQRRRRRWPIAASAAVVLIAGGAAVSWSTGNPASNVEDLAPPAPLPMATPGPPPSPSPTPTPPSVTTEAPTQATRPTKKPARKKPIRKQPEKSTPDALSPGFLADPFEGG